MTHLSRREFTALAASTVTAPFAAASPLSAATAVSAAQIVERITKNIGVEWKADTVDGVKAGDPATVVSGVVTTAMASLIVLRRAVAAGANLIISCEPTFYGRNDARNPPAGRGGGRAAAGDSAPATAASALDAPGTADPVYAAKNAFIEKSGLVIFRLNHHWRLRRPDPFALGLAAALDWTSRQIQDDVSRYAFPDVSLEAVAADVKKKLGSRGGLRVVGDPQTRVKSVALLPGSIPISAALDTLPSVDVVIAGEAREWEAVEYARDAAFSGRRKGLVLIGRVVSEEGGMSACAKWLAPLVPEVPIRHVAGNDPYWRPA